MAIGYNPTTVTEGLIYYIDPNNNRSYSGIGNTVYNLVNSGFGGTFVGLTTAPLDSTNTRTFYINNSTNYINGPNNIALTNNFTVSVWFKIGVYNTGSIIGKWFWNGTSAHRCWIINTDVGGSIAVVLSSDGTYTNPTIKRYLVPVSLNEYTQITFTFASGTLLVYKNGVLATVIKNIDGTFSTVFNAPTRPIQIGYFFDFSAYYNLANVGVTQIYNRVLSPSEILQNYNATKKRYLPEEQIVTDGLILNLDPGNPRSYSGTGNTIYDLAGFGNTGTLTNGPTYSNLNNGSIFFDGSNDYVDTKNTSILKSSPFTVSFWVYVNTFGANYGSNVINQEYTLFGPVASYQGFTNTFMAAIQIANNGNAEGVVRENNFGKNRWYHYCSVYDGSAIGNTERLKVYIDGTQRSLIYDNSIPSSPTIRALSTFALGYSGVGGFNYFNGNVSQVLVYNKALSSQEVQQNYNATKNRFINVLPPVRDNLILELDAGNLSSYPGSGTTWFDLSGNNLNGALTNGPTYSFLDSASSIVFDGTNDYVNIPSSSLFNFASGDFSVELVTYYNSSTSSDNTYRPAFMLGSGNTYFTMVKWRSGVGNGVFVDYSVAGNRHTITTTNSVPSPVVNNTITSPLFDVNAKYTHFVIRVSANVMTLYINSVSYGSVNLASRWNTNLGLRIGTEGSGYMSGLIPYIKFYNRALSAAEIAQNFNFYRTRYGI